MKQEEAIERAKVWLQSPFDEETQSTVKNMLSTKTSNFHDSFYKDMTFGTGGMRGVMGVGTNRINKYTLGKNTQGLSQYLKKKFDNQEIKVAIAYDSRNNSQTLAQEVANVFSANQIKVFLFSELRPTPELSFAVRKLGCQCGIVLTASHNPPEYNGYKVYWEDGGQIVPPEDKEIVESIKNVDFSEIYFDADENLIIQIDKEIDDSYINTIIDKVRLEEINRKELKIVFTSLHGTSISVVPQLLHKSGYDNICFIEEQCIPDGNFSTVKSPNPEEQEALARALEKAEEIGADIVIGTDPDADRLGIAVRNLEGKLTLLSGNQSMIVLTDFLLKQQKEYGYKGNEYVASTVVSSPMIRKLAESYTVGYEETLTGFKWIGKTIKDNPNKHFIGGGEESYGYLVGDFVRDKDAISATLLACEIATYYKNKKTSFYNALLESYLKLGYHKEELVSITKKGIKGSDEISQMMNNFREQPPLSLAGEKIEKIEDYKVSKGRYIIGDIVFDLHLPKENLLIFYMEKGTKVAIRPSGTEPKIKFYLALNSPISSKEQLTEIEPKMIEKIERIKKDLELSHT